MATRVIFACVQNAGRSQMAAAFFNSMADPTYAVAFSAGTEPGPAIHPEVVETMREVGIDLSGEKPQPLTPDLVSRAHLLVTMGCREACPKVRGLQRDDWPFPDPHGQPAERVRQIRDEVRAKVQSMLVANRWNR